MLSLLVCLGIFLTACEKKDPSEGRLIPYGQTLKLKIWTVGDADFLDALAREFTVVAQTSGVTPHILAFATDEELQNFTIEQMAEGGGPDIILTDGNWIAQNIKKLSPIENDESFTAEKFRATFVRSANETLIQNEKIYGVPLGVDSLAIFYNDEYLVDHLTDRNSPARIWTEFRTDVEKLSKTDNSFERFLVSGAAIGRVDNLNYGVEILENLMLQTGVQLFSNDFSKAVFTQQTGIDSDGKRRNFANEAVQFFTSFADPRYKNFSWSKFLSNPSSAERDMETFARGKVSMIFGYSRDLARIREVIKKLKGKGERVISERNVKVSFFPQFEDPKASASREIIGHVRALAVPQTSKNTEIAWKFLKFAIKKDNLKSFHDLSGLPTARLDLIKEQESVPHLGVFVRQAKFARPNFIPISKAEFHTGFENLISVINAGKMSVDLSLKNLEDYWNSILQRKLYRENYLKSVEVVPKISAEKKENNE